MRQEIKKKVCRNQMASEQNTLAQIAASKDQAWLNQQTQSTYIFNLLEDRTYM